MLSAATLAAIYWAFKCLAALLACAYGVVKLLWWQDRKRQRLQMSQHEFVGAITSGHDLTQFLPRRRAPIFATDRMEKVARYADVSALIRTGDVLLFSGRTLWSYLIRVATFSPTSHVGIAVVDSDGIWVVDSCEGVGVTKRRLVDDVRSYPGQWYWAEIATGHRTHYGRKAVGGAAQAMLGQKYGWVAIIVQAIIHAPILRELAYFGGLDRWFGKLLPFCSAAVVKLMRIGGVDPVRARDPALCTPQDVHQSAVIAEPIALIP